MRRSGVKRGRMEGEGEAEEGSGKGGRRCRRKNRLWPSLSLSESPDLPPVIVKFQMPVALGRKRPW